MRYANAGKFSSIHRTDEFLLEMELTAKRLLCEIPDCIDPAVSYLSNAMPSLICDKHRDLIVKGMASSVKAIMVNHMRRLVFEASNRAYAHSEEEHVFNFDPTAAVERYLQAPVVSIPEPAQVMKVLARPAIAILSDANADLPLLDLFPSF